MKVWLKLQPFMLCLPSVPSITKFWANWMFEKRFRVDDAPEIVTGKLKVTDG